MKKQLMMACLLMISMLGVSQSVSAANESKTYASNNVLKSTMDTVPLYVLNGKKISPAEMAGIKPTNIESISILKDQQAKKAYGDEGKNGVVLVVTKSAKNFEPVYYLDGKKISKDQMNKLDASAIESVTVLKDAKATEPYGEDGKNGVILIVTKAAKGAKKTNK